MKKEVKQNVQKKIEDVLYGIDYNLGNAAETVHKAENAISDTGQRLQDTFNNAKNATDPKTWIAEFFMDEKMPHLGDHLKVQRSVYTHHSIYIGDGKVIHYLLKNVQIDTLEDFAKGSKIIILSEYDSPAKYSRNEIANNVQ